MPKSRTRNIGKEKGDVRIFSSQDDRIKAENACTAFGCIPCIAVYVETDSYGDMFLTSLKHYKNKYALTDKNRKTDSWKMTPQHMKSYINDREISHVRVSFDHDGWNQRGLNP